MRDGAGQLSDRKQKEITDASPETAEKNLDNALEAYNDALEDAKNSLTMTDVMKNLAKAWNWNDYLDRTIKAYEHAKSPANKEKLEKLKAEKARLDQAAAEARRNLDKLPNKPETPKPPVPGGQNSGAAP